MEWWSGGVMASDEAAVTFNVYSPPAYPPKTKG
jgi:hypothetical protein